MVGECLFFSLLQSGRTEEKFLLHFLRLLHSGSSSSKSTFRLGRDSTTLKTGRKKVSPRLTHAGVTKVQQTGDQETRSVLKGVFSRILSWTKKQNV